MLLLRSLDDDTTLRLTDGALTIGRGTDNDLVINDPSREVSKTHCRIEGDGGRYVLIDLSINGVQIEGRAAPMGAGARHALASGDVFVVGRRRFGVTLGDEGDPRGADAMAAPRDVDRILGGQLGDGGIGGGTRASAAVTGEAQGWLGALPLGSADDTIRQPMGWEAPPPAAGGAVLPDGADIPVASEFANRSEHAPALNSVVSIPQSQQLLPTDWFDDEAPQDAGFNAPDATQRAGRQTASIGAAPGRERSQDIRQALADGGRVDPAALAGVGDADLLRRCGEALRACLDALDALEAAQGVAEHDCGLPTPAEAGLWIDFFAHNRDPLLTLLAEPQPGPAQVLAQRTAALANRQRAFGRAVADAAHRYEAALSPSAIEAETRSRLRAGPLTKLAAWSRFVALHAELADHNERGEALPGFLALLRRRFARALNKRA